MGPTCLVRFFKKCQHDIYKACIKRKTTTCNWFDIIPENVASYDISPSGTFDPIHSWFPLCWCPITAIDYVSFCNVQTRAEHSQRAPRHSDGRLSLQIASIEATSPCPLPPLPDESAPIQSFIWTLSAMPHILLTPSGQDPCLVSALFPLHSSDLGRPAVARRRGLIDALHGGSNVLWSLQATEMRFKWSSTQGFVISLIKFAGDPLPTAIYIWRSNGVYHKWTQELYSIKGSPTYCGVSQTADLQPFSDTGKRIENLYPLQATTSSHLFVIYRIFQIMLHVGLVLTIN